MLPEIRDECYRKSSFILGGAGGKSKKTYFNHSDILSDQYYKSNVSGHGFF